MVRDREVTVGISYLEKTVKQESRTVLGSTWYHLALQEHQEP
jgi:hypothetical protein